MTSGRSAREEAQSRERYEAFIQTSSEGIWLFELDKPIPVSLPPKQQIKLMFEHAYLAEANVATAKMYGFRSPKSIIGMRLTQFMPESDPENIAYLNAFIAHGYKLSDVESHEVDKHGNDKFFRNSLIGVVEDGLLYRAWGTQHDVTAQRSATQALQRSEQRLNLALQASNMGLWEWEVSTGKLYWSQELRKMFGVKNGDEITYEKYISLLHPDDRARANRVITHSMQTGESYQFEHRVIWPDGSTHWILGKGRAYLEDGKPVRMIGTSTNIEKRKKTEAIMKRQNTFLEMLHDTAMETSLSLKDPINLLQSILHQAGNISDTEHAFIHLRTNEKDIMEVKFATGLFTKYMGDRIRKGEGLTGKVWKSAKTIIVKDYDTWKGRQTSFPKGLVTAAVGLPLRGGRGVHGVIALFHTEKGKMFDNEQVEALSRLADLASITLRNARLFQELQESEERFRNMADTAPVLIWVSGPDKQCNYFNEAWLKFTGKSMEHELGAGWMKNVHPDDLKHMINICGSAFESRRSFTVEFRLRRHDGKYRWIMDTGTPRSSPRGEFQGYIGSCIDIEDLKQTNDLMQANSLLKTQRAQLLALNKTKDEFIALASHQLRTPATAVKQYTSLLMHEFAGPITEDQRKFLQIAFDSNERQLQIISDLLKTAQIDSRRYTLEKKSQDISKIINAAVREVSTTAELKNQRIVVEGVTRAQVEIDANEMKLVLVNLLENASKYSFPDSDINLIMHKSEKFLEISVIDTGVGISPEDTKRIFEKFTRIDNELSDTVTGTGFGLYWVKRIIGLHGGTIKVTSQKGKGSKFIIRLPR
jgi:PAS domain S-box-containing protein